MMFLTKNVSICSLDHMSLFLRGCPAVLNYSLGKAGLGECFAGLGVYPWQQRTASKSQMCAKA